MGVREAPGIKQVRVTLYRDPNKFKTNSILMDLYNGMDPLQGAVTPEGLIVSPGFKLPIENPTDLTPIQEARNKLNEFGDRTTPQGKAWANIFERLRSAFNGFKRVQNTSK